jgi:hypothetical protein
MSQKLQVLIIKWVLMQALRKVMEYLMTAIVSSLALNHFHLLL